MKKKQLMAMPALHASDEMLRLAKADKGRKKRLYSWTDTKYTVFERDLYTRAVEENGILKVAIFQRDDLKAGKREPHIEVYISRKEERYLTWVTGQERWSEASVEYHINGYYRSLNCWEEEGTRELVNSFLGTYDMTAFYAVSAYQTSMKLSRLRGRHQKEKARIDEAMKQVPEMPKDWPDWVYHSAYSRAMYMMYRYRDKENRAYCTACGKEVHLKKSVKHQDKLRCPECHAEVMALSWNKQKTITDHKKPAILQERKDRKGYVLRIFESRIKRRKEGDWRLNESESYIHEKFRFFLHSDFSFERGYEYTFFKNRTDQELRWCNAIGHGWYGDVTDECILYHKNMKRLREGTVFRYMPIENLFSHNQGYYGYPVKMLRVLREKPGVEYLIKLKLYHLVWDLTCRGYCGSETIDWNAKKPWEALKVDKGQLSMCISMDISQRELNTLQEANRYGIRLTRQQVEWYTQEMGASIAKEIFAQGNPEKAMRYLKGLKRQKIHIGDYVDYLNDLKALRIPVTPDLRFPKNFASTHARYSEQRLEHEENVKKAELESKNRMLQEMIPELRSLYMKTKADDYLMILPESKEDFNREGRENHNCVGGSYFDKMLQRKCTILFLRKKEEPDKAFCTVEMDGDRVVQCRAVRNSTPPDEVKNFMERYSREIAARIRKRQQEESAQRVKVAI